MFTKTLQKNFSKAYSRSYTRVFLLALGALFFLPALISYLVGRRSNVYRASMGEIRGRLQEIGEAQALETEVRAGVEKKLAFFGKPMSGAQKETERIFKVKLDERCRQILRRENPSLLPMTFSAYVEGLLQARGWEAAYMVLALPAMLFALLMSNPFAKYIFERVVMMLFVVLGVIFLVFTILYLSPMEAAPNILGELATEEQIAQFNASYGLDKPYSSQLFSAFRRILTLNPGKSYMGGEDVMLALVNKFPVTLQLTFMSLVLAVLIAVPAGIMSALRPYSVRDYGVMLMALVGLSIPAFWFALILTLNFSVNLKLLPANFVPGQWKSFIMPTIVMGTSLAATTARMTRSSMLEVVKQDYIVTAKAKGLGRRKVILRHALGNAMIPIVTVIGIQFGGLMSGSTVIEKVFNINGMGRWLVDKLFIPDIPVVLAGVVYIAVIVSLVNLIVDILYAFLDPRIKAKIKGS